MGKFIEYVTRRPVLFRLVQVTCALALALLLAGLAAVAAVAAAVTHCSVCLPVAAARFLCRRCWRSTSAPRQPAGGAKHTCADEEQGGAAAEALPPVKAAAGASPATQRQIHISSLDDLDSLRTLLADQKPFVLLSNDAGSGDAAGRGDVVAFSFPPGSRSSRLVPPECTAAHAWCLYCPPPPAITMHNPVFISLSRRAHAILSGHRQSSRLRSSAATITSSSSGMSAAVTRVLLEPYLRAYGDSALANTALSNTEMRHFYVPGVGALVYTVAEAYWRRVVMVVGELCCSIRRRGGHVARDCIPCPQLLGIGCMQPSTEPKLNHALTTATS